MRRDTNRRTVLKSLGSGAAVTLGGASIVSADDGTKLDGRVAGVTYDTLTHKTGKPAVGRVNHDSGELRGRLEIAGFSIPLDGMKTTSVANQRPSHAEHSAEFTGAKYRKNGYPLHVRIEEHANHLSGILSRPTTKFGELGFYVVDAGDIDAQKATAAKSADPRWVNSDVTFEIPDEGLPTDSAISRLHEVDPSAAGNGGGN